MEQQGIWSERHQGELLLSGMVLVTIAILVPLFWIAKYNFMSIDDFSFAVGGNAVWEETGSVLKVLIYEWSYAWDFWKTWQGTVTAEWIKNSLMAIFAEDAYYVGAFLPLGGFVLSEICVFLVIFRRVFRTKWLWGAGDTAGNLPTNFADSCSCRSFLLVLWSC